MVRLVLKDYAGGAAHFQLSLRANSANVEALFQLGVAGERQGFVAEACSYVERVLSIDPRNRLAGSKLDALKRPLHGSPDPRVVRYGVYEILIDDDSHFAQSTLAAIDALTREYRPSLIDYCGAMVSVHAIGRAIVRLVRYGIALPFLAFFVLVWGLVIAFAVSPLKDPRTKEDPVPGILAAFAAQIGGAATQIASICAWLSRLPYAFVRSPRS